MPWKSPEFALATFQHSPSAEVLTEAATGVILAANHRFAALFGHQVDEVVGRTTVELALWYDRNERAALVRSLEDRGEFAEVELQLCDAGGTPIPTLCSGSVLTVGDKKAYLIVITDLRARKALEQRVAAARASFLELFQNSPILMTLSDLATGRFLDCNQAFCSVTGFPRAEVVGAVVFDLPLWEDLDGRRQIMAEVAEKQVVRGRELRFRHRSGTPIWGRCTFSVTAFEGVRCLLASIEDITAQKALEREFALKTSVLQYLFDHSDDPLYVKDLEGTFLLCNRAAAQMIGGLEVPQVEGRSQKDLMTEPALSQVEASDRQVVETGALVEHEQEFVVGERRSWVLDRKGPWKDEAGRLVGVVGVAREITLQKGLEEHLRRQNQMKDRLLTVLAHDLRGPLGGASELINLVAEKVKDQPELAEIFDLLQRSSRQTYDLLESLLSWVQGRLSPLGGGAFHCDVGRALAGVQAWLGPLALRKGLDLVVEAEPGLTLALDERSLQTVVRNLGSNAIKFTPQGGRVILRSHRTPGHVVVEVADTGVGMPSDKAALLFGEQPVASHRGTDGEGGSGLGLMFCADLMRDLGGTITVQSQVGTGSTFVLRFPSDATQALNPPLR